MESFDEKYARIHREIQQNKKLVSAAYKLAIKQGWDIKNFYHPFELLNDVHLGLDLGDYHNQVYFHEILAKMRLIYEVSNGQADLSQVYVQLEDQLGIISEDMSCGKKYDVADMGWDEFSDNASRVLIETIFAPDTDHEAFERTMFVVRQGNKIIRTPIVDLDHVEVHQEYRQRYKEYCEQYQKDKRFIISEV